MRGLRGWKFSCSCQSSRRNTCQKQHVDILLLILISITTRHRMILAIFYCSFPLHGVKATIEASGAVLQRLLPPDSDPRLHPHRHLADVGRCDRPPADPTQLRVGDQ